MNHNNFFRLFGLLLAIFITILGIGLQGSVPADIHYPLGFCFGIFTTITLFLFWFNLDEKD